VDGLAAGGGGKEGLNAPLWHAVNVEVMTKKGSKERQGSAEQGTSESSPEGVATKGRPGDVEERGKGSYLQSVVYGVPSLRLILMPRHRYNRQGRREQIDEISEPKGRGAGGH
jgi:hypothetical protein